MVAVEPQEVAYNLGVDAVGFRGFAFLLDCLEVENSVGTKSRIRKQRGENIPVVSVLGTRQQVVHILFRLKVSVLASWYTTLEAFRTFLREETIYPGSAAASGITWAIKKR